VPPPFLGELPGTWEVNNNQTCLPRSGAHVLQDRAVRARSRVGAGPAPLKPVLTRSVRSPFLIGFRREAAERTVDARLATLRLRLC
jgi:hypothetical protein